MTTKEIFIKEVDRLWNELRKRDDTIFENIEIQINAEEKFNAIKEKDPQFHIELINENSVYEKKKMIRQYFWDRIVGDLYEHTLNIMKEANILEEALESFEKSYKIETTAELILENGIFAGFKPNKKKELTENVIEMCFYPYSYVENHKELLDENSIIEEGAIMDLARGAGARLNWMGERIRDIARLTRNIYTFMVYALVTPATFLIGSGARAADSYLEAYDGRAPTGINPSLRKFYDFIESMTPINFLFKFLNKDLFDVASLLKKVNNLEDDYLQDILREMKSDPNKLIQKCWDKNKHQLNSSDPSEAKVGDLMSHFFNGKGIANFLRNPFYNNETQIALILKEDAAKPRYQKMFYDFRVCVYEKLFEVILGFAKTIYSMDDASYEVIKAANDAHKQKNFKAFFDLKPKQENEEAMFKIMRALVSIDSIANSLEKRKGHLVADKYIDKFVDFLRQNVKQVYQELNEMANQRKYNEDRYNDDEPTDEEKAEAIQKERFDAKKSIFAS